jgi:hypothetical protein
MVKRPRSDHYEPISWDDALDLRAAESRGLDSPDEAMFYTSGRLSNRRRSCCSSSHAGSAPTPCPTVTTCATSPVVSGCRRRFVDRLAATHTEGVVWLHGFGN